MNHETSLKMIDKSKSFCCGTIKTIGRIIDTIFSLNGRQTTICIAVHQIALSSFVLVVLLVGVSHAGEMQNLLHSDMADEAERSGFYDVLRDDRIVVHDDLGSLNRRRFASAQHLATLTEVLLYTVTVLLALYLLSCAALLHGAVRGRREFVLAWLVAATMAAVVCVAGAVLADSYRVVQDIFGSRHAYRIVATIGILSYIYGILCVSVFALELSAPTTVAAAAPAWRPGGGDKGERLLLLDRAAHSNVLSEAQLHRLTTSSSYQFV